MDKEQEKRYYLKGFMSISKSLTCYCVQLEIPKADDQKVTIEDGEKFVFETQRRNELEYKEFVRCSVIHLM